MKLYSIFKAQLLGSAALTNAFVPSISQKALHRNALQRTGLSPSVLSPLAGGAESRQSLTGMEMVDAGLADSVAGAWASYNEALEADPLLTKSVTAGVILGAADLAGQAIERAMKEDEVEQDGAIDIARAARFAFFGLVLQAPWNHFYYLLLDGVLPPTVEPWTATTGVKVVIDQFVQAPIFTVLIFCFLGLLEGKSTDAIKAQLDEDYKDTMLANCAYLPY
mmetsp:Transcript_9167/g.27558  ORF Transcript_9167/g.27558 Transcript_9167/m.27558 type:complete len:222 (-) Transcript_9167:506-1171(-)